MTSINIEDSQIESNSLLSPFTPTTLIWENINYSLPAPNRCSNSEPKKILSGVSGYVKPGNILAIMGSTGAGKSTLLDILAGRTKKGTMEGTITANNQTISRLSSYNQLCGYVTQDDCLFPNQTVNETFQFVADLKLSSYHTPHQRSNRVSEVINDLGLDLVKNSRIGSQFDRGLSGGEKKRVSIGCELITNPGLLFLDEPTTGLDSFNAQSVMERLKILKGKDRTLVCTIHQPRTDIFLMFDLLMILSQGRVVYFGPAVAAITYLSALNFQCPLLVNVADFLMDTVVLNERALSQGTDNNPEVNLKITWESSAENSSLKETIREESVKSQPYFPVEMMGASWVSQFFFLSRREFFNFVRNPLTTYITLAETLFIGFVIGSIYFQVGYSQASIQNREGALFFILTNQAFSMLSSLDQFIGERPIFQRERASGTYSSSAYFVSKCLVEAPLILIYSLLFGIICYWLIGFQNTFYHFFIFESTLILSVAVAGSLFILLGALV
eukprot:TRINITY_DN1390_c0_g1_i2.p1 TRINITY_DN1390_c0_g1~~TRINITY_DN1390_c0_g1_i2.p1  ORF type:complete len:500 (-),score=73.84 TRINITY_DN1390_c0_g1_i2:336-1835(-)